MRLSDFFGSLEWTPIAFYLHLLAIGEGLAVGIAVAGVVSICCRGRRHV